MSEDFNFEDFVSFNDDDTSFIPTNPTEEQNKPTEESGEENIQENGSEGSPAGNSSDDSKPSEDDKSTAADEQFGDLTEQFNFWKESGLLFLPEDYQFDNTPEGLEKAIEDSKANVRLAGAQAIFDELPDQFKVVLEYALNGGNNVKEVLEYIEGKQQMPIDINKPDFDDDTYAKAVIGMYLSKTTKLTPERINKTIQAYTDSGALGDQAESIFNDLKELLQQEEEELVMKAQREREMYEQNLKKAYDSFKGAVDKDSMIPDKKKQDIIAAVWNSEDFEGKKMSRMNYIQSKIMSNPEHLAQYVNLLLDYDPEKGFRGEKVEKKIETVQNLNFRERLMKATTGMTRPGMKGSSAAGKSGGSLEDFLKYS